MQLRSHLPSILNGNSLPQLIFESKCRAMEQRLAMANWETGMKLHSNLEPGRPMAFPFLRLIPVRNMNTSEQA